VSPPADELLRDGDTVTAAGLDFEVLAIPGHSAGHVVYLWRGGDPMLAFVGDVIFAGSIGRSDFPDGDFDLLTSGIRSKLFTLPDATVLLPGHGPSTTVGREKRTNPFVGEQ
jgi:glyoxylase-like metal-dependent hydrolase (beta-lactamase superfamily II)